MQVAEPIESDPTPQTSVDSDKPEGPISAAIIAVGIGAFALGLLVTLSEMSEGLKEALTLSQRVGPLSGKTSVAVAVWLASWAILHLLMRRRNFGFLKATMIAILLMVLGLVGTFPPIFELFASE